MEEGELHGLIALLPQWAVQHLITLPSCWNNVCELCQWRKDLCSPSNLTVSLRRNHTLMAFWNWHGKKCGWSSQSLGQCYFICVLPPFQWQRIAPVFKKRHISSSSLEAEGKGCSIEKGCSSSTEEGCYNSLSQAEILLSHTSSLSYYNSSQPVSWLCAVSFLWYQILSH